MRYLMYTEVPLQREHVHRHLKALDHLGSVMVIVPARPLRDSEQRFLEIEQLAGPDDPPTPEMLARWRLREAITALEEAGFEQVTGRVEAAPAMDAIEAQVAHGHFDAVVVVTEPIGIAGWVHMDLPSRIERHIDEPVIHIELEYAR